jgi:hypothetical protein
MPRAKKNNQSSQGLIVLFGFFGTIVIGFFFWGTVQVDFILRKTEDLNEVKMKLQTKVDALRVQLNKEMSYQTIVERAKAQNLEFISASHLKDLPVDYQDFLKKPVEKIYPVQYAGMPWKGGKTTEAVRNQEKEDLN